MSKEWMGDEDMGHGLLVLVIAAWISWQKREELARQPAVPCYWNAAQQIAVDFVKGSFPATNDMLPH